MTLSKKKLLVLIPQNIIPNTDGGKTSIYNSVKFLPEYYIVKIIIFIGINEKENGDEYSRLGLDATFLKVDKKDTFLNVLKNIFEKQPLKFSRYSKKNTKKEVLKLCTNWRPDFVICHHAHLSSYAKSISKLFPSVHIILREHNIEYEIVRQYLSIQNNYIKKIAVYWQYKKTRKFELLAWQWFDKIIFISNSDLQLAMSKGISISKKFYLLPDAFEINYTIKKEKRNTFLFTGSLSSIQNAFNLKYFIANIWIPWKKLYKSTFELWITGCTKEVLVKEINLDDDALEAFDIKPMGFVNNLASVIQSAKYFLSPTIIGAGLRIKVLEALSNSAVVFLTATDFKMLDCFIDCENVVLYKDIESFNMQFVKINSSNALYENISQNAFNLIYNNFQPENFKKEYLALIDR